MKQKYQIIKDEEKKSLIIREYAELDKDVLSPLCEETYPVETIRTALAGGKERLIAAIRTKNMYPPGVYTNRIAEAVAALFANPEDTATELIFDDVELLARQRSMQALEEDLEEPESEDIDDLLTDDYDEDFEDKDSVKNLKVADDEYGDVEEE